MPASVYDLAMGRKEVVTTDKYGNTRTYEFRRRRDGAVLEPVDDYTLAALEALWDEGIPVEWDPSDLTAQERRELDSFCTICASALTHTQTGPRSFETRCEECGHTEEVEG